MNASSFEIDSSIRSEDGIASTRSPRRRSTSSRPFSSLLSLDSFSRRSISYSMLPPEPMKLTVLKLDGSSFDVEVFETATLAELKLAVESAFNYLQGPEKVSWRHVWGQFCLCYAGQNLLTETDCLTNYGIKDGDQLQIVRHISINYDMETQQSTVRAPTFKRPKGSLSRSSSFEERDTIDEGEKDGEDGMKDPNQDSDLMRRESALSLFMSVKHSYSPLPTDEDGRCESTGPALRCFQDIVRKIMVYCAVRNNQKKYSLREL